jgi:glycine cleavage system H lipoate-binding protein/TusA-related sulfurtransferase
LEIEHCEFPEDRVYDLENNVWVKLDDQRVATIGITSVHAALAGRLTQVKFKAVGELFERGRAAATIESVKYFGAVRAPLTGILLEKNSALETSPKLANDDPYGHGWFAKMRPSRLDVELQSLLEPSHAVERIRGQIGELRIRCFRAFPDHEMWEIGVECAAVLVRLDDLIGQISVGEVVHIVSDDPTADIEMVRWSDQTGQEVLESRWEGKLAHFIVRKVK